MKCSKMTGGLTLQLTNSQYYIFWYNNQKIFYELSDKVKEALEEAENLYELADEKYQKGLNNMKSANLYEEYVRKADNIMEHKLKNALNEL